MARMSEDDLRKAMSDEVKALNPQALAKKEKGSQDPSLPPLGKVNKLVQKFERLWAELEGPPLVTEVRFDPVRRWRLDYVHVSTKIAIELEGGIYTGGRHVRGKGYKADAEKYRAAAMQGYTVLRVTTGFSKIDLELVVTYIRAKENQEHHG